MSKTAVSRRSFLAGAGTLLASLTLPLPAGAATTGGAPGAGEKIVIVHTNDVHAKLVNTKKNLGYAVLKDYAIAQRSTYGEQNVSLVDVGDNFQGENMGMLSMGEYPACAIAAVGYDVMTVGNHDLDYGMEQFTELCGLVSAPVVCCNFRNAAGANVLPAYHVVSYPIGEQTVKVAYVGVITPSTLSSTRPSILQDEDGNYLYDFCQDDDGSALYEAVQTAVDQARDDDGADYVVLLAHLGQEYVTERWRSDTVVANTTGIDVVIDGHSHEKYVQGVQNKDGRDVVITQAGTKFSAFGRVEIDPAAGTATAQLTSTGVSAELIESWDGSNEEVAAAVAALQAKLDEVTSVVICTSEADLETTGTTWDGEKTVEIRETNVGDFCTDALMAYAKTRGMDADLAIINRGTLTGRIAKGEVTYGDLLAVYPYTNQIVRVEVSGQYVLDMLEAGAASLTGKTGRFLQVSDGVEVVVRTDIDTPVVTDANNTYVIKIEGERRIASAKLNGVEIDPAGRYVILGPDYVLTQGGFPISLYEDAGEPQTVGECQDALLEYAVNDLNKVIGEEYGGQGGQGRITITAFWQPAPEPDPEPDAEPDAGGDTEPTDGADSGVTDGDDATRGGSGPLPATGDGSVLPAAVAAAAGACALAAAALE